jgi:hypothetical protein
MTPRQRTTEEHASALYERLMDLGWLHTHFDKADFIREFQLSLIDADKNIVDEVDPLEMFSEFNMTRAREESESTYSREQDRATAIGRDTRHREIMAKWKADYWWREDCPACRMEGTKHKDGCPASTGPGRNSPKPKKKGRLDIGSR